jgi:uncharacterized protein
VLRVRTRLAPSPIHGLGLFAAEFIPAGAVVWAFDPPVDQRVPLAALDGAPARVRSFVATYGYLEADHVLLCGDDARFLNHARPANCSSRGEATVALRDIRPGEELTDDYATTADFEADPALGA